MTRTPHGRHGFSLAEVLVAMFIVSIGLMAILTMFPIGMLQMASAVKDDRCAQAAANAIAKLRAEWKAMTPISAQVPDTIAPGLSFLNPTRTPLSGSSLPPKSYPANIGQPSYAVYLDPIGRLASWPSSVQQTFIDADQSTGIARTTLSWITSPAQAIRHCSLLDDILFDDSGRPDLSYGGQVQRDGRYSWAYLIKLPAMENWWNAKVHVIVYAGRTIDAPFSEPTYPGSTFAQGSLLVSVPYSGVKPPIRRGTWILDATMTGMQTNGFFYRVVNVDDAVPGTLRLEIQRPAEANGNKLVVMEGVAEVFDKQDSLSPGAPPVPY